MADRTHSERINFGKLREVIQPPNLIELQISSYLEFLQKDTAEKAAQALRASRPCSARSSRSIPTTSA
jgi:DNA-directed RNA polymerase beta subunit